jgi:Inner membrane component of T3SS, cytoplasmic domain
MQLAADAVGTAHGNTTTIVVASLVGLLMVAVLVVAIVLQARKSKAAAAAAAGAQRRPCRQCGRVMLPEWTRCFFCGWTPPPPTGQLEFIHGPLTGQVVELVATVTTLGSQQGNTVVLADPAVSRKHVGIRRDASGYELADLGSTNGVYVNGQRLPKRLLAPGDIVRIGQSEMVFRHRESG